MKNKLKKIKTKKEVTVFSFLMSQNINCTSFKKWLDKKYSNSLKEEKEWREELKKEGII